MQFRYHRATVANTMLAPNLLISALLIWSVCQHAADGRYVDVDEFTTLVAEVAAMKEERLEFNSRITELETKLGIEEAKFSAVETKLVVTETKLAGTEEKLRKVEGKLDQALSRIDELEKQPGGWRDQGEVTIEEVDNADNINDTDVESKVPSTENRQRKGAIRERSAAGPANHITKRIVLGNVEQPVAFSTSLDTGLTGLGNQHPIKFDRVHLNIGNGFDATLGVFICPVTGVYVFQSALMADHYDYIQTEIVKEGTYLVRMYAAASTTGHGWDQGFNSAITTCNQGQHVWVRVQSTLGTVVHGERFSSFSGYLLWQS